MPAQPPPALVVEPVAALSGADRDSLAALLVAVVAEGASVGFLSPLDRQRACAYWAGKPGTGELLLVARDGDTVVGTVQVLPAESANGTHRAEIAKLLVHPGWRRRGIGRALLAEAEMAARAAGKILLVLDTREGDPSNALYRTAGWIEAGRVPKWAKAADGRLAGTVFYYKDLSSVM